ncbi:MAG: hypothetical protein WD068_00125 [Candidatus Babeliales bacterium]
MHNHQKGLLYLIGGGLLFFIVAGPVIIQLSIALLGLYLMNYGLRLRGRPPLFYFLSSWIDRF